MTSQPHLASKKQRYLTRAAAAGAGAAARLPITARFPMLDTGRPRIKNEAVPPPPPADFSKDHFWLSLYIVSMVGGRASKWLEGGEGEGKSA